MKAASFEYIGVFYNRKRQHSTLGYRSPTQFLESWISEPHQEKLVARNPPFGRRKTEGGSGTDCLATQALTHHQIGLARQNRASRLIRTLGLLLHSHPLAALIFSIASCTKTLPTRKRFASCVCGRTMHETPNPPIERGALAPNTGFSILLQGGFTLVSVSNAVSRFMSGLPADSPMPTRT